MFLTRLEVVSLTIFFTVPLVLCGDAKTTLSDIFQADGHQETGIHSVQKRDSALEKLKIMTFNVQNFFSQESERGMNIADIILSEQVDVVGLQELRDEIAAKTLTEYLNNIPNPTYEYKYISVGPFPSSGNMRKEWYTFIYRNGIEYKRHSAASPVAVNGFTQLLPPIAAEFMLTTGGKSIDFTVATIHVTADPIVQYSTHYEINGFHDFVVNLLEQPHCYSANLIALGDFNQSPLFVKAGWLSSFVKNSHFQEIGYSGSSSNTNYSSQNIRVDRIYVYEPLRRAVSGTAHVLRQSKYLFLDDNMRLSDHYPMSFEVDFSTVHQTYYRPKPYCLPSQTEHSTTDCPTCLSKELKDGVYPANAKSSISSLNVDFTKPICRGDAKFMRMESVVGSTFAFIDEERQANWCGTPGTACLDCGGPVSDVSIQNQCADRIMCQNLLRKLYQLDGKIKKCLTEQRKIIIHEAWDEPNSQYPEGISNQSLHSIGQEAIISLSLPNQSYSSDSSMVLKIASLAVCIGFDYVEIKGDTVSIAVAECNQENAEIPVCQKPFLCDGNYIGSHEGPLFQYFETIRAVCKPGYQLRGQITRLCVGGEEEWTGSDPLCVEQCLFVNIPSCSEPVFDYIKGTITFKCQPGCSPTPGGVNSPLTCNPQSKKFEGSNTFTCQKVSTTCPDPLRPLNGYMDTLWGDTGEVGSVVRFSCDDSSRLDGNGIIYCKNNGQWSHMFPTCKPIKKDTELLHIQGFTYVRASPPVNPYSPSSLANATYTGKLHFPYPALIVPGLYVKAKQRIIFKGTVQSPFTSLYLYYTVEADPSPGVRRITTENFNGYFTKPLPYNFTGEYDSYRCLLHITGVVTSFSEDISKVYGSATLEFCNDCSKICSMNSPKLIVTVSDPWGSNLTGRYDLSVDTSDTQVTGSKMFQILKIEMTSIVRSTEETITLKERLIKTSATLPPPLSFSVEGQYSYARDSITSSLFGSFKGQTFDLNASISLNILNAKISKFEFDGAILAPFTLNVQGNYKLSTKNLNYLLLKGYASVDGVANLDIQVSTRLDLLANSLSNFEFEGSLKAPFYTTLSNGYQTLSTSSISVSGRLTRTDGAYVIIETSLDISERLLNLIKITGYLPSPFDAVSFEGTYNKSCSCSIIEATVVGNEFSISLSGKLAFYSGTFSLFDHLDVAINFFHPLNVQLKGKYFFNRNNTTTYIVSASGEFDIPYISLNAMVEALINGQSTAELQKFHVRGTFDQPLGLEVEGDYFRNLKQVVLKGSLDYPYALLYGSTVYTFRQNVEDKISLLQDLTLYGKLSYPFKLNVSGSYSFSKETFTLVGTVFISEFLSLTTNIQLDTSTYPPSFGSIEMSGMLKTVLPFPNEFTGDYDVVSQSVQLASKSFLGSAELSAIAIVKLQNDTFLAEPVKLEAVLEPPLSIRVTSLYFPNSDSQLQLEGRMRISGASFAVRVFAEAIENAQNLIMTQATLQGQITAHFMFNVSGTYTSGSIVTLSGSIDLTPITIHVSTTVDVAQHQREYGAVELTGDLKSPLNGSVFAKYGSGDLVMRGTVYEADLHFSLEVTFSESDVESVKFSTMYSSLDLKLFGYYDFFEYKLPLEGVISIPESPDLNISCFIDFNKGKALSNLSLSMTFMNPPLTLGGTFNIKTMNHRLTGKFVVHNLELDASTVVHLGSVKSLDPIEISVEFTIPFRSELEFTLKGDYNKKSNEYFYLEGVKSEKKEYIRALVITSIHGIRVVSLFIDELSYADLLNDYVGIRVPLTIPQFKLEDVVIYKAVNSIVYEEIEYERGYISLATTTILFLPKFTLKASMSSFPPIYFEGSGKAENMVDWKIIVLCEEDDLQCESTSPQLILQSQLSYNTHKVLVRGGIKFMGVVFGNTEFDVKNEYMEGTVQLTSSITDKLHGVQPEEIAIKWSEAGFTTDLMIAIDGFTFIDVVSPDICNKLNGYVGQLVVTLPLNLKTSFLIRRFSNGTLAIAAQFHGQSTIQHNQVDYKLDIPYSVIEVVFSAHETVTWDNVTTKISEKIQKNGLFIIEKLLTSPGIRDAFIRKEIGIVVTGNIGEEACNKSSRRIIKQPPGGGGSGGYGGGYGGGSGPGHGAPADNGNYVCLKQQVTGGCKNSTPEEEPENGETCDRIDTRCAQNCSKIDGGTIQCSCREGYFLVDGSLCRRYDICIDEDPCSVGRSICVDPLRSHEIICSCKEGFEGDGYNCQDINECNKGMCPQNSNCVNTFGSYKCTCINGYKLFGGMCTDIDECTENSDSICFINSRCNNTSPGYQCLCSEGYELNVAKDGCINVNECVENTKICGPNGLCNDTDGSYECSCISGYKWTNGVTCEDINECQEVDSPCPMNSLCLNTNGSYVCNCIDGYEMSGSICVDIDECMMHTHNCDLKREKCNNMNGNYSCICQEGYTEDENGRCIDVDECRRGIHTCALFGSSCTNTNGSYKCNCNKGFQGNGFTCEDITECELKYEYCGDHSVCEELLGSYNCSCEDYYERNGESCIYIDPCVSNPCGDYAAGCIPLGTEGKHRCQCKLGYEWRPLDGTCTVVDCGQFPLQSHIELGEYINLDYQTEYNQTIVVRCKKGYVPKEDFHFTCQANGTWSGGSHPVCRLESYCEQAVPPDNGTVEYLDLINSLEKPHEGVQVKYSCDFGYELKGFMTSTCKSFGGWSNPAPKCVPKLKKSDLYPFGSGEGDTLLPRGDHSSAQVTLPTAYPFNDKLETILYVSVNGLLTFDIDCETVTAMSFPNEFKSIAPFWADADTTLFNNDDSIGKVWYRIEQDQDLLERNLKEVREVFAKHDSYSPDWLLIVTWYKIGYYKQHYDKLNTFQAILSTDGNYSFVTFLYPTGDIRWTTGDAHGGVNGLGGDPAKVGLNVGDWDRYYRVEGSGTNDVINVDLRSNTLVKGMYMFEVDSTTFATLRAFVNEISTVHKRMATTNEEDKYSDEIKIFPKTVTSAGGNLLAITGITFEATAKITCTYSGNYTTVGAVASKLRAYCPVPRMKATGWIQVQISVEEELYYSHITADSLDLTNKVEVTVPGTLLYSDGDQITLKWNPSDVLTSTIAPPSNYSVIIEVYSLHNSQWELTETYDHMIENSGEVELVSFPSKLIDSRQQPITIMAFRVVCADSKHLPQFIQSTVDRKELGIWSHLVYHAPENYQQRAPELCQAWYIKNQYSSSHLEDACPCRTDQAEQTNSGFYELVTTYEEKLQQFLSPKSTRCFHSMISGQRCCYDTNGLLITGPHSGSTPDSNIKKWFIHQTQDIIPQIHCCVADYSNCSLFYDLRPSDNCQNFTPDMPGILFGNGHIITLDGLEYTHQGKGEYVVLRAHDDFSIQVRAGMDLGNLSAITTSFVSIAATAKRSDVVEVQRSSVRGIDILVNGERLIIGGPAEWKFRNVVVRYTDQKTVSLKFSSRGIIKLETVGSYLSVQIHLLSSLYRGHVEGLLGQWNGDPSDDLQTPNGVVISRNSNSYDTHFKFVEKWRVNASDSLFTYQPGASYKAYNNFTFVPIFDATELPYLLNTIGICNNNLKCLVDVAATGHTEVGQIFMDVLDYYNKLQEMSKPISCNRSCDNGGACVKPNTCSCPLAFTGENCKEDVDECALSLDNCPDLCVNTDGGFNCICSSGYIMIGGKCSDVDECLHANGSCSCEADSQCSATCINTQGSYYCSCSDRYTLAEDMRTCIPNEQLQSEFPSKNIQIGIYISGGLAFIFLTVLLLVSVVQCCKQFRKRNEVNRDQCVPFSDKKNLIPHHAQQCEI